MGVVWLAIPVSPGKMYASEPDPPKNPRDGGVGLAMVTVGGLGSVQDWAPPKGIGEVDGVGERRGPIAALISVAAALPGPVGAGAVGNTDAVHVHLADRKVRREHGVRGEDESGRSLHGRPAVGLVSCPGVPVATSATSSRVALPSGIYGVDVDGVLTGRDDLALVVSPVPGGVVVAVAVVTTGNLGVAPLVERSLLIHALLDSSQHLAAGVDDGDGHVRRPCQAVVNGGGLVGHPGITGEEVSLRAAVRVQGW